MVCYILYRVIQDVVDEGSIIRYSQYNTRYKVASDMSASVRVTARKKIRSILPLCNRLQDGADGPNTELRSPGPMVCFQRTTPSAESTAAWSR